MFFQSPTFLYLFLPMTLAVYYACRRWPTVRDTWLFTASLGFYAWGEPQFVIALIASLFVNFTAAKQIQDNRLPRLWLTLAISFDLGLLLVFKYLAFFADSLGVIGIPVKVPVLPLPLAISFVTFQAISYIVDVYRKAVPAERNLLHYGLYAFLFPHLIAGPIVRYADLAEQLHGREHTLDRFADGVRRFILGLAKKLLLADSFAITADIAFRLPPDQLSAGAAWLGAVCYSLQIYFDFSGYSDMAIGLGRMFGFEFAENFKHPYAAASITDFWRRWHISLSSWFRDYVYIPLGGNRVSSLRVYINLLIVFILCGFWHGANWTFLAWGLYHGVWLIIERLGWLRLLNHLPVIVRHLLTLAIVLCGWVLFRAESFHQAGAYFRSMFGLTAGSHSFTDLLSKRLTFLLPIGLVACLPVVPWLREQWSRLPAMPAQYARVIFAPLEPLLLLGVLFLVEAWVAGGTYAAFIYFRF
ncbi:MBOAT family O-acyltransferase [soil metagenome]